MRALGHIEGQALVEGVVGLSLLVVLFWAVPWVGRYLDLADVLQHASRLAAFNEAVADSQPGSLALSVPELWLPPDGARWRTPDGRAVANSARSSLKRETIPLAASAQPGQGGAAMAELREGWSLADQGMPRWRASARLVWLAPGSAGSARLELSRQTTVARGAGFSTTDEESSERLLRGGLAYARAADLSHDVGKRIADRARPLDAAWGRPSPHWDWLRPWQQLRTSSSGLVADAD